jgi:hypothetical protein
MQEVAVDDKAAVILHLSFNQDCSCFSIGTSNGFVVFNSDPLKVRQSRLRGQCHAAWCGGQRFAFSTFFFFLFAGAFSP